MGSTSVVRELGALATDVTNARLALERVAPRLEPEAAAQAVKAIECLRRIHDEIRDLLPADSRSSGVTGAWVLDPHWLPVALDVASRRQTVLLTVAANALRALARYYETCLDQTWPDRIESRLTLHRERVLMLEEHLLDQRQAHSRRAAFA